MGTTGKKEKTTSYKVAEYQRNNEGQIWLVICRWTGNSGEENWEILSSLITGTRKNVDIVKPEIYVYIQK